MRPAQIEALSQLVNALGAKTRVKQRASLTDTIRENLLRRAATVRLAGRCTAARPDQPAPRTDFSTLPGYDELRLYERIGEKLGLGNPYFRLHDGRAGAETKIDGRMLTNFASYDYLGLNAHPEITAAAHAAIDRYGVSSSASRCVAGERPVHLQLERAIAEHYGVEDSLVLVSGYSTNVSVIGQIVGPNDLVVPIPSFTTAP